MTAGSAGGALQYRCQGAGPATGLQATMSQRKLTILTLFPVYDFRAGVAVVERSEPTDRPCSGGSLRSTPATQL